MAELKDRVGTLEVVEEERSRPENDRITVLVVMPHLKEIGLEPTRELTYGCKFEVKEGDLVYCPPTPKYKKWTTGLVTALHGNGYFGPVKQVRKMK